MPTCTQLLVTRADGTMQVDAAYTLFVVSDLSSFPLSIQTSNQPNIEILGHLLVMLNFAKNIFSSNHQAALTLLSTINDLGSVDPQVALVLLRLCSSFCKLAHIARATPPHLYGDV